MSLQLGLLHISFRDRSLIIMRREVGGRGVNGETVTVGPTRVALLAPLRQGKPFRATPFKRMGTHCAPIQHPYNFKSPALELPALILPHNCFSPPSFQHG